MTSSARLPRAGACTARRGRAGRRSPGLQWAALVSVRVRAREVGGRRGHGAAGAGGEWEAGEAANGGSGRVRHQRRRSAPRQAICFRAAVVDCAGMLR